MFLVEMSHHQEIWMTKLCIMATNAKVRNNQPKKIRNILIQIQKMKGH